MDLLEGTQNGHRQNTVRRETFIKRIAYGLIGNNFRIHDLKIGDAETGGSRCGIEPIGDVGHRDLQIQWAERQGQNFLGIEERQIELMNHRYLLTGIYFTHVRLALLEEPRGAVKRAVETGHVRLRPLILERQKLP